MKLIILGTLALTSLATAFKPEPILEARALLPLDSQNLSRRTGGGHHGGGGGGGGHHGGGGGGGGGGGHEECPLDDVVVEYVNALNRDVGSALSGITETLGTLNRGRRPRDVAVGLSIELKVVETVVRDFHRKCSGHGHGPHPPKPSGHHGGGGHGHCPSLTEVANQLAGVFGSVFTSLESAENTLKRHPELRSILRPALDDVDEALGEVLLSLDDVAPGLLWLVCNALRFVKRLLTALGLPEILSVFQSLGL